MTPEHTAEQPHGNRSGISTSRLYAYGIGLGLSLLSRGKIGAALPYLIRPVNYWRTVEYQFITCEAGFCSHDRILDIGSPKLLSLYLAEKVGAEVFATDIEDYFIPNLSQVQQIRRIPPERLHLCVEDGRKLSFADRAFTKVYSISVLEHIPDDGDSDCLREIRRVLVDGGRCILTAPFSPASKVEYRDADFYWAGSSKKEGEKVFYSRRYSEEDLHARLIAPSGMRLKKLVYVGDKVWTHSEREFGNPMPIITGPIQPLLSKLIHTKPTASWKELKKPLCAMIVLEK